MNFQLHSRFQPTGDQPQAIEKIVSGIERGYHDQVLLGVTGSGKTFTMAQVIQKLQRPTLIISHNKTLAGQLYQEFRDFFPKNGVSYFVSYYDFYQPEAYIPSSSTYIEKEAEVNELIDSLRLQTTSNILSRSDAIVVASVSCIYNIGRPESYENHTLLIKVGDVVERKSFFAELAKLQYAHNQFDFKRSTFRDRGENIDINLSYNDFAIRLEIGGNRILNIRQIDPLTGQTNKVYREFLLYPAKQYLMNTEEMKPTFNQIRMDMEHEVSVLLDKKKLVEADRLRTRTEHDLEVLAEVGYVNGIENYSRYFDGRAPGDPPYTLLDYFQYAYKNKWLMIIDESHMTIPQVHGMNNGDHSRKQNLIDYGFRLQAAFDNRPMKFEEFENKMPQTLYVSATPDEWELEKSQQIVEQLVRPTGIPDPEVDIRPVKNQIPDLISEIEKRVAHKKRVLVTTLTKRIAEDLSAYLKDKGIKAQYLHADIKTLERSDILDKLRKGEFDVLIGINLLREGLDLPEVTLVAILDADKEGFLRSRTALVQTMGRAARNTEGTVIIYTDTITKSIKAAMEEVSRRRAHQLEYNSKHHINPKTIYKPVRERIIVETETDLKVYFSDKKSKFGVSSIDELQGNSLTGFDKKKILMRLKRQMKQEAENLNFEFAAKIRDKIKELELVRSH